MSDPSIQLSLDVERLIDARPATVFRPYGPERSADDGAPSVDQLIAFTGRDPSWRADG